MRPGTSYPVFTARRPDDDLVLHDQGSQRQAVTGLWPRQRNIPDETSAFRVDGHEMAIDRPHEQRVVENRQPAVDAAAAQPRQLRRLMRYTQKIRPVAASIATMSFGGCTGTSRRR